VAEHHKNRGKLWEAQLDAMHAYYMKTRQAYAVRCYPEMRQVGDHALQVGAGPPDYVILAGGRTVIIEAKQCAIVRWAFRLLPDHQAIQLDAAERHGAVGVVLIRFSTAGLTCVLLWRDLRDLWWAKAQARRGDECAASIHLDAARELAIWSGKHADYLPHLLEALSA
jgi:penicillin-binding protein-related factor A (putative recombinase)